MPDNCGKGQMAALIELAFHWGSCVIASICMMGVERDTPEALLE